MNAFEELQEVLTLSRKNNLPNMVRRTGELIAEKINKGGVVFTAGNGGSSCDAAHLAEELLGKYKQPRRPLPAMNLGADGATITCIGNDFGFEEIFARQIEALGTSLDVLVCFSTSGMSENIIRAIQAAHKIGVTPILLTGSHGGNARKVAGITLSVPTYNTARIQEVHTVILHSWLEQIESLCSTK